MIKLKIMTITMKRMIAMIIFLHQIVILKKRKRKISIKRTLILIAQMMNLVTAKKKRKRAKRIVKIN